MGFYCLYHRRWPDLSSSCGFLGYIKESYLLLIHVPFVNTVNYDDCEAEIIHFWYVKLSLSLLKCMLCIQHENQTNTTDIIINHSSIVSLMFSYRLVSQVNCTDILFSMALCLMSLMLMIVYTVSLRWFVIYCSSAISDRLVTCWHCSSVSVFPVLSFILFVIHYRFSLNDCWTNVCRLCV